MLAASLARWAFWAKFTQNTWLLHLQDYAHSSGLIVRTTKGWEKVWHKRNFGSRTVWRFRQILLKTPSTHDQRPKPHDQFSARFRRWGSGQFSPLGTGVGLGSLCPNLPERHVGGQFAQLWGSETAKLLLVTGFCGGFSTFSTLIREVYALVGGSGWSSALLYAALSFVLGLVCLLVGLWLGKTVSGLG